MTKLGPFIHLVRFIILLLVQGLIIHHIELHTYVHPMLYILFMLLLPIEWPAWLTMTIAFVYGLFMDVFTDTLGLHVSAMVFLAALRPLILRVLSPREGYEFGSEPGIHLFGVRWFALYAFLMTFGHHIWYFFMEKFGFSNFADTLSRTFFSTIISVIIILLVQYLFYNQKART